MLWNEFPIPNLNPPETKQNITYPKNIVWIADDDFPMGHPLLRKSIVYICIFVWVPWANPNYHYYYYYYFIIIIILLLLLFYYYYCYYSIIIIMIIIIIYWANYTYRDAVMA